MAVKTRSLRYLIVLAALASTGVALLVGSRDRPREIRLVVRDMSFYIDGQDVPNPILRLHAGEEVRVLVSNTDAGIAHDFGIDAWDVRTPLLTTRGSRAAVSLRVPRTPGTHEYTCKPHSAMMRGTIEVE
jgi:hypothetical protein